MTEVRNINNLKKKIKTVDVFLTLNICNVYFNRPLSNSKENNMFIVDSYSWNFKIDDIDLQEKYYMYLELISKIKYDNNEEMLDLYYAYVDCMYDIYLQQASITDMLNCTRNFYYAYMSILEDDKCKDKSVNKKKKVYEV